MVCRMEISITGKQTDLTYIEMSKRAYWDIVTITGGELNNIDDVNIKVELPVNPNRRETWQIVKVLDDKETSTQAFAFKKGDEIVLAYRGSQEGQDWVDTDGNYLVLGANRTPSETRAFQEAYINSYSGNVYIPDNTKTLKNPFDAAVQFAEDVKKEFPNATIDTTGHSLGGALATYVRVLAKYHGQDFIRQTTTYAAPNVFGMFAEDVQEKINSGAYRQNTIDYTDARDTFGTLNDHYPQVGIQHLVRNEKIWLGNHSSENFGHLFLSDGEIRLTPQTIKTLATKAGNLHHKVKSSFNEIENFNHTHDAAIKSIQTHFEGQIGYRFDKLEHSDVMSIINKWALSTSGGVPKFYDTSAEEALLSSLNDLQKDALDIKRNLEQMARDFENKDNELANWLSIQ